MTRVALFGYGTMAQHIYMLLPEFGYTCSHIVKKNIPDSPLFPPHVHIHTSLVTLDPDSIDICIEAALPESLQERVEWAIQHKKPIVIATTGWDDIKDRVLSTAHNKGASLVWSSNFSLGIWLFRKIARYTAQYLKHPLDFDIAMFEMHHKKKKDAPSGTMKSILDDMQKQLLNPHPLYSSIIPPHTPPQKDNSDVSSSIDIATLRVGSVPGTHTIWLDGPNETIQLTHTTRDRATFARGVITAVKLVTHNPGVWEFDTLIDTATQKEDVSSYEK